VRERDSRRGRFENAREGQEDVVVILSACVEGAGRASVRGCRVLVFSHPMALRGAMPCREACRGVVGGDSL
jgi:hypothetical protein